MQQSDEAAYNEGYNAITDNDAAAAFEEWVKDVGGFDESPETVRNVARSFFIAGYWRGSKHTAIVITNKILQTMQKEKVANE